MASKKPTYTAAEAADFMIVDFSDDDLSDFTDSGSDLEPEVSSETEDETLESYNEPALNLDGLNDDSVQCC